MVRGRGGRRQFIAKVDDVPVAKVLQLQFIDEALFLTDLQRRLSAAIATIAVSAAKSAKTVKDLIRLLWKPRPAAGRLRQWSSSWSA